MNLKCLIGLHDWSYTLITDNALEDSEIKMVLKKVCMKCMKSKIGKRSIKIKVIKPNIETYQGNEHNKVIYYDPAIGIKTCRKCDNKYFDKGYTMKVCRKCGQRYEVL